MRILILGGTQFVGRAMAEAAIERGHAITLFHRGQTNPDLFGGFTQVDHLLGDRNTDCDLLSDQQWDAVIDCNAYFPHQVQSAVDTLKTRLKFYAFVSTISVYDRDSKPQTESSVLLLMPEGAKTDVIDVGNYGPLKSQCEEVVRRSFPDQNLIIRAGLQIGRNDHTCRFSNWVERIGRQDQVMVPSGVPMTWQFIDALDTAAFTLDCVEAGRAGTFNVTGHAAEMPDILNVIRSQINPDCRFVPVSEAQIAKLGLEPWKDIALWLREEDRSGLPTHVSNALAVAAGLKFRPLSDSIAEIWEAAKGLEPGRELRAGLSPERERALLSDLVTS